MHPRLPFPGPRVDESDGDGDIVQAALSVQPPVGAVAERRLIAAVLLDAIEIYLRNVEAQTSEGRRELAEVRRWIRSEDTRWPFSFRRVCEALGLEPERVRAALRTRRDQRLGRGATSHGPTRRARRSSVDSDGGPPVSFVVAC